MICESAENQPVINLKVHPLPIHLHRTAFYFILLKPFNNADKNVTKCFDRRKKRERNLLKTKDKKERLLNHRTTIPL